MTRRLIYRLPVTAILLLIIGRPASAQAPQQTTIFPSGEQLGTTASVTIEGANLQGATGFLGVRDTDGHHPAKARSVEGHDPRLSYTLPKSGRYFLQVRDLMYRGGTNFTYALRVGKLPTVLATMPIGGKRGETIELALEGV